MTVLGVFPPLTTSSRHLFSLSAGTKHDGSPKRQKSMVIDQDSPVQIRNPRDLFPVRNDFIRSAWVQRARTKRAQEYEELYPFLSSAVVNETLRDVGTPSIETDNPTSATMAPQRQPEAAAPHIGSSGTILHPQSETVRQTKGNHVRVGIRPTKIAEYRRAFRRLEPEKMFRAPRAEGEYIWAYWGKEKSEIQSQLTPGTRSITTEGFVMVPAKKLSEVRTLESALRHERGVLKTRCLLALDEGEISAHKPLEATRMAVHEACGREMTDALRKYRAWASCHGKEIGGRNDVVEVVGCPRKAPQTNRTEMVTSTTAWRATVATTKMTTTTLAKPGLEKRMSEAAGRNRVAEMQRVPVGWRAQRWLTTKKREEEKSQLEEARAMFMVEMGQRHVDRYVEAWECQKDYDLYCVLAFQFWPLEPDTFRAVDRPGKSLFIEIDPPARVIEGMWRRRWPLLKERKRKGCVALQALWRGHKVRRRWLPIVRLRVKIGHRTSVRPCFSSWARLTRVYCTARQRFKTLQGHLMRACFKAWIKMVAIEAMERTRKLQRAGAILKNVAVYRSFRSWQVYARAVRRAHLLFLRTVRGPALETWIQFTKETKIERAKNTAAIAIQRHARGRRARIRHRATLTIIQGFDRGVTARRARVSFRHALAEAHRRAAEDLLRAECDAEVFTAIAREEKRLTKLQEELLMADAAARRSVARRLRNDWWSAARAVTGTVHGGGELRREIEAVRKEWKALEEDAKNKGSKRTMLSLSGVAGCLGIGKVKASDPGESSYDGHDQPREGKPVKNPQKGHDPGNDLAADEITGKSGEGDAGGAATLNHPEEKHPTLMNAGLKTAKYEMKENDVVVAAAVVVPDRSANAAEREARRRILSRECVIVREFTMHDFEVRNPPPLKCAAPACGRIFTRDKHYLAHWAAGEHPVSREPDPFENKTAKSSKRGTTMTASTEQLLAETVSNEPPFPKSLRETRTSPAELGHPQLGGRNIALLHLAVANVANECEETGDDDDTSDGFSLMSSYVTRLWGQGPVHNTLLFWRAVGAWRRHPTSSEAFVRGAIALRRSYVDPNAPQEATLPCETRKDLLRVLETLPEFDAVAETTVEGDESNAAAVLRGNNGMSALSSESKGITVGYSTNRKQATKASNRSRPEGIPVANSAKVFSGSTASFYARGSLRPTSFDQAQWCALLHLADVVGPGFLRSDLGRRAAALLSPDLKKKRRNAQEIVQLERRGRLLNEAAEMKIQLMQERENAETALAESALEIILESTIEQAFHGTVAAAEILKQRELDLIREEDMLAEAATIEAAWVIEPLLLEDTLVAEIAAISEQQEEVELMTDEDDWVAPEHRQHEKLSVATMMNVAFDLDSISAGREGAFAAATTIQCAWRQRSARVDARRCLTKVYVKRPISGGGFYYENTVSGESQWERLLIVSRLFPHSAW